MERVIRTLIGIYFVAGIATLTAIFTWAFLTILSVLA